MSPNKKGTADAGQESKAAAAATTTTAKKSKSSDSDILPVLDQRFWWAELFFGFKTVWRVVFNEDQGAYLIPNVRLLDEFARTYKDF